MSTVEERAAGKGPLVSVGVPVHNGEAYLDRCLTALLEQDYAHLEIIISENASTDESAAICRRYAQKDARIRIVSQREKLTAWDNFVVVLEEARGDYFFWAACDDDREPAFVSALVAELEEYPSADLAISAFSIRSEADGSVKYGRFKEGSGPNYWPRSRTIREAVYTSEFKMVCAIYGLFRRPFLIDIANSFRQGPWGDHAMMIIIAQATDIRYVDRQLYLRVSQKGDLKRRYGDEPVALAVQASWLRYLQACWMVLGGCWRCPRISLFGKFYAIYVSALYLHERMRAWMRGRRKVRRAILREQKEERRRERREAMQRRRAGRHE